MQSFSTSFNDFSTSASQQLFPQRRHNRPSLKPIPKELSRGSIPGPERIHNIKKDLDHRLILILLICWLDLVFSSKPSSPFDNDNKAARAQLPRRGHSAGLPADGTLKSLTSAPSVLEVFQVHQPVLTPFGPIDQNINSNARSYMKYVASTDNGSYCTQSLMEHSFASSVGQPFVGYYNPPPCKFNRVVMNFSVTVEGNQYDRLGLMYFGDTEVWRTSTAEPLPNGVEWTYMKDMSEYLSLWNQSQKLIFDLSNVVDSKYTGIYNTSLTAIFFNGTNNNDAAPMIIPISSRQSSENQGSVFALPADNASNTISFPQNANRALFSFSVSAATKEEVWWSNLLGSYNSTVPLPDFSPWREVQIYVDGQLAGVEWPFPSVFTGGVDPYFWAPIVGIDAFDLREHEIDLTPWLPALCNGERHTFEIRVAGLNDSGSSNITLTKTVEHSWYVTGKIFIWLDSPSSVTSGSIPTIIATQPNITLYTHVDSNGDFSGKLTVSRSLSISSTVKTQQGTSIETWSQLLTYSVDQSYTSDSESINSTASGNDTSNGGYPYQSTYTYTLQELLDEGWTNLSRSLDIETYGDAIYPSGLEAFTSNIEMKGNDNSLCGWYLSTSQNASAVYDLVTTAQKFDFGSIDSGKTKELYSRDVEAVNGVVVKDKKTTII